MLFSEIIGLYDGRNKCLRDIVIIGAELLGVFWQAVAAVAKGWIVIVGTDAWVKADTFDDVFGIEVLELGIGV